MLVAAILAGIALGLLVWIFIRVIGGSGGYFADESAIKKKIANESEAVQSSRLRRTRNLSELEIVRKFLNQYRFAERIALLLKTTRLDISVSAFILFSLVIGTFSFMVLQTMMNRLPAIALAMARCPWPYRTNTLRLDFLTKSGNNSITSVGIISSPRIIRSFLVR